jgi:hypothetical protein
MADGSQHTGEELITAKGLYGTVCVFYGKARGKLRGFFCREYSMANRAFTSPPNVVKPLLRSGIGNLRFAAAVYTNHVNILTYR